MLLSSLLKQHGVRFALSIAIILLMLLHISGGLPLGFIQKLENFSYDMRLNFLMPRTHDNRIVIVDIDEKSLKEQGRWPWGRDKSAQLVNQLFGYYQINTLGFDVVFAEKDESSGLKNLERMQQQYFNGDANFAKALQAVKPMLDYDQTFADSLKNRNVVLGYFFNNTDINRVGQLPGATFGAGSFGRKPIDFVEAAGYGANLSLLQNAALTAGHFNPEPDADGISRKITVLIKHNNQYYDALAVAVVRAYFDNAPLKAEFASLGVSQQYAGLESFSLAGRQIPVDDKVAMLIPYRGLQGSFTYVSATDVINKKVPPAILKNKIVLVGTTAQGLMDLRATPVQNIYPGVEVHANIIAGILDNNIKARPGYVRGAEFLLVLLAGLLLAFTLPVLNPLKATLMSIGVLLGILVINVLSWQYANLVLPIAASLLMIGLIYLVNMSYGFFVESRGKRQLTGLFGQYVPPELVNEMALNPESINLAGENREMTVLFTDIRGFTNIAEGLDPTQLTRMMNEFLTPLTQIIHSNRGTIDKYMGDAIMAFWGAPLKDENHAQNALNAAIEMKAALKNINEKFVKKGWPVIKIGIGINTGNMVVGNMGSSFRMAYTVMGDSVNLGSRLESLTKYYGVDIVVSDMVRSQTPQYVYRELDLVRVKGKDIPVAVYEPLDTKSALSDETLDELKLYREALKLYRNQQWDLSEIQFINLQKMYPQQSLYALYIKRIGQLRQAPPGVGWDGAFNVEYK
ncbi:MAG: adenylate/guanylate cyclase domain-containing protein [Pseudomonadota bacterium]